MKKVGDLMKDLGFRADAPDSTKRAFIENLVRASGVRVPQRSQTATHSSAALKKAAEKVELKLPSPPSQMSFDFEAIEPLFDMDDEIEGNAFHRRSS